jgi:hypothetical protein
MNFVLFTVSFRAFGCVLGSLPFVFPWCGVGWWLVQGLLRAYFICCSMNDHVLLLFQSFLLPFWFHLHNNERTWRNISLSRELPHSQSDLITHTPGECRPGVTCGETFHCKLISIWTWIALPLLMIQQIFLVTISYTILSYHTHTTHSDSILLSIRRLSVMPSFVTVNYLLCS